MAQLLLFLGGELQYSQGELDGLWQLLRVPLPWKDSCSQTSNERLRNFFLASFTPRRRVLPEKWQEMPVAYLFKTEEEHEQERREDVLRDSYIRMLDVGVLPMKAWTHILDPDGHGTVSSKDFGARSNAIGLPPKLLPRFFDAIDFTGCGFIDAKAWARAFEGRGADEQENQTTTHASNEPFRPPESVPLDILRRFAIELVAHSTYTPTWLSEGSSCRRPVSIWNADQLASGFMRVTTMKLSIGQYANQGLTSVGGGSRSGVGARLILQVRDKRLAGREAQEYLLAVADHYCPCPVRYMQVWKQQRGKPLYIWRPVPPSDAYVALGMVATVTPEPPPLDKVRCVAKSFCRPGYEAPRMVWDDSGMGGKAASIWTVNAAQVLWVVAGHQPPQETFWELANDSVTFDYTGRPSVHVVHERAVEEEMKVKRSGKKSRNYNR